MTTIQPDQTATPTLPWSLHRGGNGRLVLVQANGEEGRRETPVQAACCFPWSGPHAFVSLRDDQGHELALVEGLADLPPETRQLVEEELALRNYLPRLTAIHSITDQMEFFHWKVETTSGPRAFLTRRHERPRQLAGGQMLIRDICNDIYLVARGEDMDPRSMRLLWVYLD